jgi:thiamine-monophosphate kinase
VGSPIKELNLIASIKALAARAPGPSGRVLTGIGDDTAVLETARGPLLFAADMLLEGVHFRLQDTQPELVGRKALAVNLSDIAAMAGTPIAVTVSLAVPSGIDPVIPLRIMQGLSDLAREYDVAVCGGDTNVWNHSLVIDVAVIGEAPPQGAVLRSGARAGDEIFVTGPLGGTILGKHLNFTPRLREAAWLRAHYPVSAMIDLSDGLATDLRHLLSASGVGAVLFRDRIPVNSDPSGTPYTLEQAICGGEDFELCFTVNSAAADKIRQDESWPGARPVHIGRITQDSGLRFEDGTVIDLKGYEHGAKDSDV